MAAASVLFTDAGDFTIDSRKQQIQQAGLHDSGVSGKCGDFAGKLLSQFVDSLFRWADDFNDGNA